MAAQDPKARRIGKSAKKKPAKVDEQNQATVEDLDREGLGIAAKE